MYACPLPNGQHALTELGQDIGAVSWVSLSWSLRFVRLSNKEIKISVCISDFARIHKEALVRLLQLCTCSQALFSQG